MPPKDKPVPKKPGPGVEKPGTPPAMDPSSTVPPKPTGSQPGKDKPGAGQLPKELYCTPETCMYQPGRFRKFFDRNQHKIKYAMAGVLFGSLVLGLLTYLIMCKNKSNVQN